MSMKKRAALAQMDYADVAGLQVDYDNAVFTRLAGARGRSAGTDFDCFAPFGGRRRCCVADNGTVSACYGDTGYTEDGSIGQVMVRQPKFYYRVEPLLLSAASTGTGYVLHRANYYVSASPKPGFRLHPAFYGANGAPVDSIFLSAYEASYYDASLGGYFSDGADSDAAIDPTVDRLCSLPGKKPISGAVKALTCDAAEEVAAARGAGWHVETVKTCAANQLLMMVEYGCMNLQNALGKGVSSISDLSGANCASLTGATAALGNASGAAADTVNEKRGVLTTYTEDGKTSVSYRGMENPWGNIWKLLHGMSFHGSGASAFGEIFIADDLSFTAGKHTGNYVSAGLTLPQPNGYFSAAGYGAPTYDWLLAPGQTGEHNALSVDDYVSGTSNLSGSRVPVYGGRWSYGDRNGPFSLGASIRVDYSGSGMGCRLVYFPAGQQ